MKGVIYARYSEGPRQTDQSIEGQVADCKAFAAAKGIDIIEIYADRHVSGKSIDGRDEFQRMMKDADRRLFDAVIVWKVDRFGRSREDIAVNKIRLRKAGVTLMYAKESIPEGPEGILLESLMEGLAEYYSADLRQKVIRGMSESAKKGQFTCGQLPIGYRRDQDKRIAIDPDRAEAVRHVYSMYLGGASVNDLRDYLYAQGITSRKGSKLAQVVVYKMLRNERYMGKFDYRGITIPAEPIIDEETFARVQAMHKGREQNAAKKAKTDYLLSCKCHCAYCGRILVAESGRGRHGGVYHYYKCGGRKKQQPCELQPYRRDDLEDLVIRKTIEDVLTDDLIDRLVKKIMELQDADQREAPAAGLRKKLEENKKRQANIVTAIENGSARSLTARLAELEAEEDSLQTEIARAELKDPVIPESIIRSWLDSFRAGDRTDTQFRRRLVDTFVADVAVSNDEITIFYNITKTTASEGSDTAALVEFKKWYPNPTGPVIFRRWIVLQIAV